MDKRSMKEITQESLHNMAVPTVSMNSHQVHLKQVLLTASHSPQQTTKQKWSNLMAKPKFIISGVGMMIAVLAIVVLSIGIVQKPVSAAELTQQSLNKVSRLSPGEFQELDMRVDGNPKDELEAAKNAKDLVVMTYDEYMKQDRNGVVTQAPGDRGPGEKPSFDQKNLKFLRYTDSDGAVHTIGVDKDGLPVMIMVSRQNKDGSSQGMVRIEGEGSGHMTGGIKGPQPEGMTTCSGGEKPVCTNSDGSPAPAPDCHATTNGGMMCSAGTSSAKQQ